MKGQPTDMKLKKIVIAACLALCPMTLSAQEMNADTVRSHCAQKWDNDFSMQSYCIKKSEEGFATYVEQHAISQDAKTSEMTTALNNCETKWAPQWDMVAYCGRKNFEGLLATSDITKDLPKETKAVIVGRCAEKWGTDFAMRAYCMTKQVESWKTLQ